MPNITCVRTIRIRERPNLLWVEIETDDGLHAPAAIFQEVVRATLATWYRDLVTDLPVLAGGMVQAPTAPGLGTALLPQVRRRPDAVVRETNRR
jgi:hypothetical protein